MNLPFDYAQRVYAGVLGKVIGVYLGRPIEGWPHERILGEIGEVWEYCRDQVGGLEAISRSERSAVTSDSLVSQEHMNRHPPCPMNV
jgi:ADP-ribosylglycohydrolase